MWVHVDDQKQTFYATFSAIIVTFFVFFKGLCGGKERRRIRYERKECIETTQTAAQLFQQFFFLSFSVCPCVNCNVPYSSEM